MSDPGPEYLRGVDLLSDGVWGEYKLKIKEVFREGTQKAADGTPIQHPVISFENTPKRMILKTMNEVLLACATGVKKPSQLSGKEITVYPAKGDWFGQKDVVAVRVRVPAGKPRPFIKPANLGKDITGTKQ